MSRDTEIAGPIKAKLFVACDKPGHGLVRHDTRGFDAQGKEVTFFAADEPKMPISQGWLRVTQRKLDTKRTTEWMPWHAHDENQPLKPGEVYEVDVEIWPASVFLPEGIAHRATSGQTGQGLRAAGCDRTLEKGSG